MEKRLIQVGLMGMNKDVINSKIAQQYAYEIKNFRLSATQDSNAFELTTERGTKSIPLVWTDSGNNQIQVYGTIIGYCILNNYLVLFTKDHQLLTDRIYRITLNCNESYEAVTEIVLLYEGDTLGFNQNRLIDAIPYYETELIQKVYWIDGINQPRVINIVDANDIHINDINYDPYGFVQEIYGDYNSIGVTKGYVGGMFHAGVIQYAYSFFNENAQETPVIDVTPLYYIAHEDRGEKPDTRVGCTFTLSLEIPEDFLKKFDYVRFYSIYRSSLDTTPLVKVINEIKINNPNANDSETVTFTDDNTQGYVYDAQQLLIRNNKIIPQTFNYKDGKLFFGNFKNDIGITSIEDDTFEGVSIQWFNSKSLEISPNEDGVTSEFNVYNYESQLKHNSREIKTFKGNEWYHLGVQLQDKYGNWSQPYYITTSKNDKYPAGEVYTFEQEGHSEYSYMYSVYNVAEAKTQASVSSIIGGLQNVNLSDYIRIRPVVSFPTASERAILCQGIVNPTVFNLGQRVNGTCHAQSSWFFRPYPNTRFQGNNGVCSWAVGMQHLQWENYAPLFNSKYPNGEIQCMYSYHEGTGYSSTRIPVVVSEFSDSTNWEGSSDPLFFGLTEYEANELKLLNCDPTVVPSYNYYWNIGTIKNPQYEYTDEGKTYTFYARYVKDVLFLGGVASGYKYTVTILYGGDGLGNTVTYYYYVSTTGELWYYEESSSNQYTTRARPFAYNIDSSDKSLYDSYYFVDTQICTLNSPELEFDTNTLNTDVNNYSLKLVGSSRFVNNTGTYNIIAQSPNFLNNVETGDGTDKFIRGTKLPSGFNINKYNTVSTNNSQYMSHGGSALSALDCWYDDACNLFVWDEDVYSWNEYGYQNAYVVYPWQRKYLNNFNNNQMLVENPHSKQDITKESNEPSLILKKILGNLRFCYTDYCSSEINEGLEFLKVYNSEEPQLLKMANDKLYSGNIDQLITCTSEYVGYNVVTQTNSNSDNIEWALSGLEGGLDPLTGYPILLGRNGTVSDNTRYQGYSYTGGYAQFGEPRDYFYYFRSISPNNRCADPIWIRYKSSPHFVFKFAEGGVLPRIGVAPATRVSTDYNTIWGTETINDPVYYNREHVTKDMDQSYLWVADIYNPSIISAPSLQDFDLLNRVWLPCGESKPLDSTDKLVWSEGDTFFQRYDCLKTYPFSKDDYQSVVEIGSFMLETRVNLDGRYDTNRGLMDNTAITKENFNLINPVYSQMNNFFQYKKIDDRFNNKDIEYKNRITWTLDKQNGDDVDQWTRVTELGILDLDGDKGKVTKIERFDNNLYIFQDKGIARLNYNENVQIPTEGNVPIEVVNSGFINGKRYISENSGLQNKWCSKSTPYGIFFKDGYSKALLALKYDERRNPIIGPLSYNVIQKWTELNIDDIYRVNFDNQTSEVLFMINDSNYPSLAYSPQYQAFTSFYDYVKFVGNYKDLSFSINPEEHTNNIWLLRKASSSNKPVFNSFYGAIKPYWVKFTSVVDGYDCIFDNLYLKSNIYEYNSNSNSMNDEDTDITQKGYDIYESDNFNIPFDLIAISDDKQAYEKEQDATDEWKAFKPIKKFGVWRGRIPRINSLDGKYLGSRIRNHWVRIGLKINNPTTNKTVIRDIKVDAFY